MDESSESGLAARLSNLASEAASLAKTIRGSDGDVPERTRRRAHNLRQHFGMLLVLSNRLAKEHGNESMLRTNVHEDGSATVAFTVDLDSADLGLPDQ